jgi:hypothetical protein
LEIAKMGKKPKAQPLPPAPEGLSEKSRRLWAEAMRSERKWTGPRREGLFQALAALDRADQARETVDREGLTSVTKSTGATHVHPAVKVEREARAQALRAFETLGLFSLASGFMTTAEHLAGDER